jgi:hypothetical protein
MKVWIKTKPRKDHKYNVTYGFDNGVRIKKIRTQAQIEKEFKLTFEELSHYNLATSEIYIEY